MEAAGNPPPIRILYHGIHAVYTPGLTASASHSLTAKSNRFEIRDEEVVVLALEVVHRREAYKRKEYPTSLSSLIMVLTNQAGAAWGAELAAETCA